MATFQSLPFDLHFNIMQCLDFQSALALKKCSSYFYANIPLLRLPEAEIQQFLERADRFPQNKHHFACHRCLQMLPRDSFVNTQRTGLRGKDLASWRSPAKARHCMNCAAKYLLSGHSRAYRQGKMYLYLCWKCKRWNPKYQRCGIPNRPSEKNSDDPEWRCWIDEISPTLQGLPKAIQKRIFGYLCYRDSIALSKTSSYFHANVSHQECALHDKFRFTHDRLRKATLLEGTACYTCFRIRPSSRFQSWQLSKFGDGSRFYWKRQCRSCFWKLSADQSPREALVEWKSRTICKRCCLLKVNVSGTPCLGCLEIGIPMEEATVADEIEEVQIEEVKKGKVVAIKEVGASSRRRWMMVLRFLRIR
ncbi:hypothetical protein B0O99DRAFT_595108 [Bisporella sp. PMI_857]|nr:hypothetical protein B0O99DRAFT_595108 [Bisporella sp. PMI_857]